MVARVASVALNPARGLAGVTTTATRPMASLIDFMNSYQTGTFETVHNIAMLQHLEPYVS